MPGQLLPLRLLNTSISSRGFSSMKHVGGGGGGATNLQDISVFSRVFPFKMKYMGLSRNLRVPISPGEGSAGVGVGGGGRSFSSGSFRPRNGGRSSSSSSIGRNSEFPRSRGLERGEFQQVGSVGKRSAQSKSLIEDEAELSDWVSDLKPDSFRVSLNSESDDSDVDNGRNRGDRGGDRGIGRGGSRGSFSSSRGGQRGGGRDGSVAPKRRRENGYDDFARSSRNDSGSFSRNSRGSMSGSRRQLGSDSDSDDIREISPRRKEQGSRGGFSSPSSRGGRTSNFNSRGGGNFQKGPKAFELPSRKRANEDDSSEDEVALGGFLRGAVREEGRASGRQAKKPSGRRAFLNSDEEDEDDDDFDDDDDDEDEDDASGTRGRLAGKHSEDSGEDTDEEEISLHQPAKGNSENPLPKISTGETASYLSKTRFDQCSISALSMKGVKDAGYEHMTVVQEATLPIILKGKDVLAKARTGTGKTVAFLLPAIEAIVKSPSVDRDQRKPPINVLVICPTRELASQAAAEANKLLKYHPSIGVQVVIGGVRLALEQKRLQANPCQILIATPGRLRDHTENTAGFATRLMGVKVLVLDEADHLLDMGFRKDIEKIIAAVPKQRQTLLFSATVPEEVRQVCHIALKRDHEFINTVEEGSEETHAQVKQMHLVAPLDKHFSLLYALLKEHIADDVDYKVLVFCTTAMVTRLVANLLSELNMNVREIHSRKPQSYRTRVSDEFRKSKGLILVTSDVSARGVDYPDVTLVIQVGLPADREQYIHRLGRTGRKGKEGEGILLLAPWEEFFLSKLKDLPLTKASVPSVDPDTRKKVERALSQVEMKNKEAAYQAWLGFYNSNKTVARDKCHLVELANDFSRSMGLDNPPAIPKLILGKMGLKNVPGLRVK